MRGVGGITENDVQLAKASNATIIGFNVRPDRRSRELAESEGVEIRTYEIIYKLIEEIEAAMLGLLTPVFEEVVTGEAEVREVFRVPRVGAIAGCFVREGVITRGSKVRFLREGTIIWKGTITSLRRFKDDAREVAVRLRVRRRPLRLPGPQGGRHHRDLRRARDSPNGLGHGPLVRRPPPLPALGAGEPDPARGHLRRARCASPTSTSASGLLDGDRASRRSPDMRQAVVFFDSLSDEARVALEEHRAQIQAAVNVQTRLKRTPKLSFMADPAVAQRRGGRGDPAPPEP